MYVKLGNHQFQDNTVALSSYSRKLTRGKRGVVERITKTMGLEGVLIATGQDAIRAAILELEAAAVDGQSCGLYHDDGTRSPHFLDNSDSLSGVRIVDFSYANADGSEYATQRKFNITLEAEYLGDDDNGGEGSGGGLLEFEETLSFIGTGGPKRRMIETLNGPPVPQTTHQRTIQRIVQNGHAMGRSSWPSFPGPTFPQHEIQERRERRRTGPVNKGQGFTDYRIAWAYHFESSQPLVGSTNSR